MNGITACIIRGTARKNGGAACRNGGQPLLTGSEASDSVISPLAQCEIRPWHRASGKSDSLPPCILIAWMIGMPPA
eukprot:516983-Rhodomonas_salina.1